MPRFYEDDWQEYNDKDWADEPASLWDNLTHGQAWDDEFGKMLFDMTFVDPETSDVRASAYEMLVEWMRDEYDIDFEAEFDWEGWRTWYEG